MQSYQKKEIPICKTQSITNTTKALSSLKLNQSHFGTEHPRAIAHFTRRMESVAQQGFSLHAPDQVDRSLPLKCTERAEHILCLTFCNIQVEEVTVQDSLDHPSNDSYEVEEALEVVAPDPVDQIQGTVQAQEEKVVSGDGFRLSGLADHKELREDGHRLQVDGEGPQDLKEEAKDGQAVPLPTAEDIIIDLLLSNCCTMQTGCKWIWRDSYRSAIFNHCSTV